MNIWLVRLLLLVAMFALSWYSFTYHADYYPTIWDYLDDQEKFEGQESEFVSKVISVQEDSVLVAANSVPVHVHGKTDQAHPGDLLRVHGHFHDNGMLALNFDGDSFFRIKQLFSLATFLAVAIVFIHQYKLTWRGFEKHA